MRVFSPISLSNFLCTIKNFGNVNIFGCVIIACHCHHRCCCHHHQHHHRGLASTSSSSSFIFAFCSHHMFLYWLKLARESESESETQKGSELNVYGNHNFERFNDGENEQFRIHLIIMIAHFLFICRLSSVTLRWSFFRIYSSPLLAPNSFIHSFIFIGWHKWKMIA